MPRDAFRIAIMPGDAGHFYIHDASLFASR